MTAVTAIIIVTVMIATITTTMQKRFLIQLLIRTEQIYNKEDLKARVLKIVQNTKGRILRAKGIVPSRDGYLTLQYLPDDLQITPSDAAGNMLCFIGNNLNRQELIKLFNEVII